MFIVVAEGGIRGSPLSRGLGSVYKRQLRWNMEEVDRLRIDKDQIAERFKNGGRKKVERSRS